MSWCYWPQSAKLIFLLQGKSFYCTKVHIVKLLEMRYLYVQIQIWTFGELILLWSWLTFFLCMRFLDAGFVCLRPLAGSLWVHWGCRRLAVMWYFECVCFWAAGLADSDCSLLLGWIKCATDRGAGSAVTLREELSATCCLCLVKTGGDLISPGSHKLDRPTCCPDPTQVLQHTFIGRERKIGAGKKKERKKNFNRILICFINLCKWCRAAVWIGVLNCLAKHCHVGCM